MNLWPCVTSADLSGKFVVLSTRNAGSGRCRLCLRSRRCCCCCCLCCCLRRLRRLVVVLLLFRQLEAKGLCASPQRKGAREHICSKVIDDCTRFVDAIKGRIWCSKADPFIVFVVHPLMKPKLIGKETTTTTSKN